MPPATPTATRDFRKVAQQEPIYYSPHRKKIYAFFRKYPKHAFIYSPIPATQDDVPHVPRVPILAAPRPKRWHDLWHIKNPMP